MPNRSLLFLLAYAAAGTSAVAEPSIIRSTNINELNITWSGPGWLQETTDLVFWTNNPAARSPHLVATTAADRRFYRLSLIAETVITNASIHTVNSNQPTATTLAIRSGRIIHVGDDLPTGLVDTNTTFINAGGRVVLPGIQDVHVHAVEAGINSQRSLFSQFGSESDYRAELAQALLDQPGGTNDWVVGAGVNMAALGQTLASPVALVDEIIPNRPAVILDDLGHGAWANSTALALLGFDRLNPDPPGGIIDRNPDTDALTGIILESASQNLIDAADAPTTGRLEAVYQAFLGTLRQFATNGITTVSDAGGYWPRDHQSIWHRAEAEGTLTVRANNAFYVYPEKDFNGQVATITALRTNNADRLVRFNQVKIYVDGIVSQATAALVDPYETAVGLPANDNRGFLYFDRNTLNNYSAAFETAGFQLHYHATGDRGTRLALDAVGQRCLKSPTPGDPCVHGPSGRSAPLCAAWRLGGFSIGAEFGDRRESRGRRLLHRESDQRVSAGGNDAGRGR